MWKPHLEFPYYDHNAQKRRARYSEIPHSVKTMEYIQGRRNSDRAGKCQ